MHEVLKELLDELDYTNVPSSTSNDTLVFVGDLVAKHPDIQASLDTIDYVRGLNAWAVRGNHDQDVINWRNWLSSLDSQTYDQIEDMETPPTDVPEALKHKWRDEHYQIAKAMSQESASWLSSRSLTLHVRSLHTYIVHAGLLPWTVPKNIYKKKKDAQGASLDDEEGMEIPESVFDNTFNITENTPLLESSSSSYFVPTTSSLLASNKLDPEMAILTVPLNRDPFTLLNMRSVKKNGKVTKNTKKGWPWAPIWNQVMATCQVTMSLSTTKDMTRERRQTNIERVKPNQCRPLNVVYGHAASRGLDLQSYSFGLDSGAVYGRSMSALVIEGAVTIAQNKRPSGHKHSLYTTPVIINGRSANVYSLKCKKP